MSDYSIGISGLSAAQKALDVIGNNIANAATEGYHRQRIELAPAYASQRDGVLLGGGVDVQGITRMIDSLLEQEILRQKSLLEFVSQESVTLSTVENAFGEFSSDGGLNVAIDEFFRALDELSAHPGETIWQNLTVTAAESMASQFRLLGEFLTTLESQISLEIENDIEQVNILISGIAELNDQIERMEIAGTDANNLRDQRDQYITELSGFIDVQTQNRENGVVDVIAGGMPVVTKSAATELEVGLKEDGTMGISIVGADNYVSSIQGGRIGALLSLKNDTLTDIHSDLDSLASAIIQQINQYHVQGVGSEGSFTGLTGWTNSSEDLSDFSSVSAGYVYMRVTDTSTGTITRTAIPVLQDASSDTLTEIASYITSNVANVNASVNSSNQLAITADTGYEFDFLPGVLSEPTTSDLTPDVSISGIYTGTTNQTYTCTVIGDGDVSNTAGLKIQVEDGDSVVIKEVNVGSGYPADDILSIGDGLSISIATGTLSNGEQFTIEALANSDTSGVLAAVGINTFFSGSNASNIAVCSDISAAPGRIATALSAEMTDNTNALQLAGLKDQSIASLSSMTPGEFYRRLVTDIGQQLMIKQMRRDNTEVIVQNLVNKQGEISGVDINEEATQLLIFEQMFQAMAKYMNTIQATMASVMDLI
ncbi:MAG: flagellar hook-associated protein FlgK [Planctomycetota bacterium]